MLSRFCLALIVGVIQLLPLCQSWSISTNTRIFTTCHTSSSKTVTTASTFRVVPMCMVSGTTTTFEREQVKVGGGARTLERPTTEETARTEEPRRQRKGMSNEAWEVRIYNDGLNTREHVARSLVQVTGMSEMDAYQTMMQAHQHGIAVVGRWVYEIAEMYHDALRKNGIVCDLIPVDEE